MRWTKRHGLFRTKRRFINPYRIVLHHTAGGTMSGAVSTLIKRRLGYHYIIDKKGNVTEFVPADKWTAHAYRNNRGTVGVSFVGGGSYGPVNDAQIESCIQVLKRLKRDYPTIQEVSSHKRVDPRGWKIDPRFKGEPKNGVNWEIDRNYMMLLAAHSGLKFIDEHKR